MPQITQIRTPIDADLLKLHLARLCTETFQIRVIGKEDSDLGTRHVIRMEFASERDYERLADAINAAHAEMRARGIIHSPEGKAAP